MVEVILKMFHPVGDLVIYRTICSIVEIKNGWTSQKKD